MEKPEYTLEFYVDARGKCPLEDWLEGLKEPVSRQRIKARLVRLRLGNWGDCKAIDARLYEMRFNFGPGFRLYFCQTEKTLLLLLIGGTKRTQERDIQRAKEYWNDYQIRKTEKPSWKH